MRPVHLFLACLMAVFAVTFWRDANHSARTDEPRYVSRAQRCLSVVFGIGAIITAMTP